jgi:hypothetical protein
LIREGGNFGPNEIDAGQCTWPGSAPAETFRVKPIGVEVTIEIVCSLASFEVEENDQDEGEDSDGTSDDTTSDRAHVGRRRRAT